MELMFGDVGERSSNCYREQMEGYTDVMPIAAVTTVTLTTRWMWLSAGITRQIDEMSSLHNVRMMDDAPGS